jgi:hypothetical protein
MRIHSLVDLLWKFFLVWVLATGSQQSFAIGDSSGCADDRPTDLSKLSIKGTVVDVDALVSAKSRETPIGLRLADAIFFTQGKKRYLINYRDSCARHPAIEYAVASGNVELVENFLVSGATIPRYIFTSCLVLDFPSLRKDELPIVDPIRKKQALDLIVRHAKPGALDLQERCGDPLVREAQKQAGRKKLEQR